MSRNIENRYIEAAKAGDIKQVKEFYQSNFSVETNTDAIAMALEYGHSNVFDFIKKTHIKYDKDIILGVASSTGFLDIVVYLAENGVEIASSAGDHALTLACESGHYEIVKYLVENGANVTAKNNYPIIGAANEGHFKIVKYLTEQGADVTAQNNKALISAATHGHSVIVTYLIKHGADVTAKNNEALRLAIRHGRTRVANNLIKMGADPKAAEEERLEAELAGIELEEEEALPGISYTLSQLRK